MKRTTHIIIILLLASLVSGSMMAVPMLSGKYSEEEPIQQEHQYLPGEVRDTASLLADTIQKRNYDSHINVIARSYGDSIVLRWAAADFPSWQYLNHVGVDIYRYPVDLKDNETYEIDTLAYALKPAPLEEWRTRYPESDSIAHIAMGTLYSIGGFTQDQSNYPTGDLGAILDVYDDQQMQFGMAVLTSEWRRDIADMLAMRFVDRNVKPGKKYMYVIRPTLFDSTRHIIFRAGLIDEIKNVKYTPEIFETEMRDSLVNINLIRLWWSNDEKYSSYEIERRAQGENVWTRVNSQTYLVMQDVEGENLDNSISDQVPAPGIYEYRILAHDAFGDIIECSENHVVTVTDLEAPHPIELKMVEIVRQNENDPNSDILATFHFEKDTIEDDYIGCKILYYRKSPIDSAAQWVELCEQLIPVGQTSFTTDVTNIPTSQMVVAAYDTAHNVSYSIPHTVRISDMRAPEAPQNFRYEIIDNNEGTVRLMWDTPDDNIDYYEIAFANDTTHEFMLRESDNGLIRTNSYVDTLATDVNQEYIYYKVRAIDYASNVGAYSPILQVLRPSTIIPAVAHIDSAAIDNEKGIYMRWVCSNEQQIAQHKLMRRVANGKNNWAIIRTFDADSLRMNGNIVEVIDVPEYNRRERYEYAMESVTNAGISSGLSLIYSARFEGKIKFECNLKLYGVYVPKEGKTRLAWELDQEPPYKGDWYFCIYRKGMYDKRHKFLMSAKPIERSFEDFLLRQGESAEYYIMIQYADGRESQISNIVTVTYHNDN